MQLEQAVTLSFFLFSLIFFDSVSPFSLFFPLHSVVRQSSGFFFLRVLFRFSNVLSHFSLSHSWLSTERRIYQLTYTSVLGRVERSFLFLSPSISVYAHKNSCIRTSMIGYDLTTSSDGRKKTTTGTNKSEKKNCRRLYCHHLSLSRFFSPALCSFTLVSFFFVIRLPRACRSLLQGMCSMLRTIMMWNRHKRSLGVVIDCALHRMNESFRLLITHVSTEVFVIKIRKKKKEKLKYEENKSKEWIL